MALYAIDQIDGPTPELAFKAPVRAATTEHITLYGLQTIDGVALNEYDRVLVRAQGDPVYNGIWLASGSNWRRSADSNGARDWSNGTRVVVQQGLTNKKTWVFSGGLTPVVGLDPLAFQASSEFINNTLSGTANPQGSVSGKFGDQYVKTDAEAGEELYLKVRDDSANTGWTRVVTSPFLNVRRNTTTVQDSKFVGLAGRFELKGKVAVNAIPANVQGYGGFWKVKHPDNTSFSYCIPGQDIDLPRSETMLQSGPVLGMHCQNTGDDWHGESYVLPHALAKYGNDGSFDQVLDYRTSQGKVWSRAELWGPTAAVPHGFVCLSACIIGGIQYAIVKDADHDPDYETQWKMYRRSLRQRVEMGSDKLRVVTGENNIYIDRTKYDLGAYVGLPVSLNVEGNAVLGMPVDGGGYTVTSVTDTAVRLSPVNGAAAVAASSGYGTTTSGTLTIAETRFSEIKFTGNKSFYQALLDVTGIVGSPGVIHSMAADGRKGYNARVYIAFSNKNLPGAIGGGSPTIMRLSNVTGTASNAYAAMDYAMFCTSFPSSASEMSVRAAFDSVGNWRVFGWYRAGQTNQPPGFWVWDENTANQPVRTSATAGNNVFRESTIPIVVDTSGTAPWIFGAATGSRSPDTPEGFAPVKEYFIAAKLYDAIDNMGAIGAAAFEWYHVSDALWQDSNTGDSPEGASIGLPTVIKMPGGIRILTNTLGDPQGPNANPGGTKCIKIDTRQFTQWQGPCDVGPDSVQFFDRQAMVYRGIPADVSLATGAPRFKPEKRDYDDFLRSYTKADGSWLCRTSGHYEFTVRADITGAGNIVRGYIWNDTDNVEYENAQFIDGGAMSFVNHVIANGVTERFQRTLKRVYCLAGKSYSVRFKDDVGAPTLKASPDAFLCIERVT